MDMTTFDEQAPMHVFTVKGKEYEMPASSYEAAILLFGGTAMKSFVEQAWANAHAPNAVKKARQAEWEAAAREASEHNEVKVGLAKYFAGANAVAWRGSTPKLNDVAAFFKWDADDAPELYDIISKFHAGDPQISIKTDEDTHEISVVLRVDLPALGPALRTREEAHQELFAKVAAVLGDKMPADAVFGVEDDYKGIKFTAKPSTKSPSKGGTGGKGSAILPKKVSVTRLADGKEYIGSPDEVYETMKADGHAQAGFCPAYVVKRLAKTKYDVVILVDADETDPNEDVTPIQFDGADTDLAGEYATETPLGIQLDDSGVEDLDLG